MVAIARRAGFRGYVVATFGYFAGHLLVTVVHTAWFVTRFPKIPNQPQATDGGQSTKGCAISNQAGPYPPNGGWLNAAKGNSLRQG